MYGDLDLEGNNSGAEMLLNCEQCHALRDILWYSRYSFNSAAARDLHLMKIVPKLFHVTTSPCTTLEIKFITANLLYHVARVLDDSKVPVWYDEELHWYDEEIESVVEYLDAVLAHEPMTREGMQKHHSLEQHMSWLLRIFVELENMEKYHGAISSSLQKFMLQLGRDSFNCQDDLEGEREGQTYWEHRKRSNASRRFGRYAWDQPLFRMCQANVGWHWGDDILDCENLVT